ncbi:MAG: PepSY domain-containing protein [Bacillaceae bacterium]|nr:PepSY domain-containing protein [Bacillaceae bacterium]
MKCRTFLLGVSVGAAAALLINEATKSQPIKPEKALKIAKDAFKQKGPVDGSWIHMVPEDYYVNEIPYKVYKGGISRRNNGTLEQYEFVVNLKDGNLLDVKQLTTV